MPSFLDDPYRFQLEDADPAYWEPAPFDLEARRLELDAKWAEYRRNSAERMARLREEWARDKREAEP